jgi:hypothetical protein
MGSQQTIKPTDSFITIPQNYPSQPVPGKLQVLWETNERKLYHRLSPYADYSNRLIGGFTTEPFNYTYIDESGKGLAGLRKYESQMFPIGSAPIDVIRVSKFLASGRGILFLGKQFLLQTGNPYNETRIYNPTSPIVAAGMTLGLGSIRPSRHLDISGLGGLARSLIGDAIPNALFGPPKITKPPGTAEGALIGGPLETTGGKGLLRAGTANKAKSHLETSWVSAGKQNFSFGSIVKNLATSLFANFIPARQNGILQRSDEGAYGLMLGSGTSRFSYNGANSTEFSYNPIWYAGGKIMRKNNEVPPSPYRTYYLGNTAIQLTKSKIQNGFDFSSMHVGYQISPNPSATTTGIRYGDNVGTDATPSGDGYSSSDIMMNYYYYNNPTKYTTVPTKNPGEKSINNTKSDLQKVLSNIGKASQNLYKVNILRDDSTVIRSGKASTYGYDRLFNTSKPYSNPKNYPLGMLQDYRDSKVVDDTISFGESYGLPTNGTFDSINTLTVLPKSAMENGQWGKLNLKGWETKQWEPYKSDLIAFFFYDVVNENFIPFRASLTGISEAGNASWEEMQFIGRGDKTYSYGGFNRNLSFKFKVVIGSIAELAPTWQRINYLTTLIKPAGYTKATLDFNGSSVVNRFLIPPMVMLTIGDFYRDQPVLIQSINTSIPEDATWETLNEDNSGNEGWSYLAKYIKTDPTMNYGQLPREVDIDVTLILLEKERALVGGANFGHAPRNSDGSFNSQTVPNNKFPNTMNRSLVVHNDWRNNSKNDVSSNDSSQQKVPDAVPSPQSPPVKTPSVNKLSPQPSPVLTIPDTDIAPATKAVVQPPVQAPVQPPAPVEPPAQIPPTPPIQPVMPVIISPIT